MLENLTHVGAKLVGIKNLRLELKIEVGLSAIRHCHHLINPGGDRTQFFSVSNVVKFTKHQPMVRNGWELHI